MGLAERRASLQFQSDQFPKLKKEVDSAAGFEVPMDVEWDTLATEGETHLYMDSWTKVYFHPLRNAFKDICQDKIGKAALKTGLKKVVIRNTKDTSYGAYIAQFDQGVLTLDHKPTSNVDDVKDRSDGIRTALEEKL
jgi:hypothetical protein